MKITQHGTWAFLFLGALALATGCGDEGGRHYCHTWCDMAVSVELGRLEEDGCEFTDDEAELDEDCFELCRTTSLETPDPADVKTCVSCVDASAGSSPTWDQMQNALNGPCEQECFAESMTEFWFEFWDSWGYEDYDFECD